MWSELKTTTTKKKRPRKRDVVSSIGTLPLGRDKVVFKGDMCGHREGRFCCSFSTANSQTFQWWTCVLKGILKLQNAKTAMEHLWKFVKWQRHFSLCH